MNLESYEEWVSIYNDEIKTIYQEETSDLRKLSMIYCALQNELNRLKTDLSNEINGIKTEMKRRDCLRRCKNFAGFAQSEPFNEDIETNKENEISAAVPLKEINPNGDCFVESTFYEGCRSPPASDTNPTATSPIIKKKRFIKYKKKTPVSPSLLQCPALHKTPKLIEKEFELKTPKNGDDSNIMESSIIEDTPQIESFRRFKVKKTPTSRSKNAKKKPHNQNRTLTQMFSEPKKKKRQIDSNMASMGIDEMLELMNQSSGSETDANLDTSDEVTIDNLDVGTYNSGGVKDAKDMDISLTFIENYDRVPEKKSDSPNYAYKEVVRGKERKKLKGWSCKECEKYYKNQNLPPDELEKKMNECSRHKSKFKPPDETYKGFWDLTFGPSPKTLG